MMMWSFTEINLADKSALVRIQLLCFSTEPCLNATAGLSDPRSHNIHTELGLLVDDGAREMEARGSKDDCK